MEFQNWGVFRYFEMPEPYETAIPAQTSKEGRMILWLHGIHFAIWYLRNLGSSMFRQHPIPSGSDHLLRGRCPRGVFNHRNETQSIEVPEGDWIPTNTWEVKEIFKDKSGQIIATSHDLTPNGGLVREFPLFQGNLGW